MTSFAGKYIATKLQVIYAQLESDSESDGMWFGDSKDRMLGNLKVHLEQKSTNIAIVLATGS